MKYLSYVVGAALITPIVAQSWSLRPSSYFSSSPFVSAPLVFLSDSAPSSYLRGFPSFFEDQLSPRYRITNDDKTFQLSLDVPGANIDDIHISVEDNHILTVSSQRENSDSEHYSYSFSKFSQSVSLDPEVNVDKLTAELKDGVLTVFAPKDLKKNNDVHMIPVKSADDEVHSIKSHGQDHNFESYEVTPDSYKSHEEDEAPPDSFESHGGDEPSPKTSASKVFENEALNDSSIKAELRRRR